MTRSNGVKLVCFDLGGVLIRICRSWREGCAAAGLDVRDECCNGFPNVPGWHELGFQFGTGAIDGPTWARRISAALNGLYSDREILAIHDAWMLGEYEGVGDVIDRIHQAGLATAALSNTNHLHWSRINKFPSIGKLGRRFASHEMRLHKPDPAIYHEFERSVGLAGAEILFFDDLPENVASAREVGWITEQIDHRNGTDQQIEGALRRHGVL